MTQLFFRQKEAEALRERMEREKRELQEFIGESSLQFYQSDKGCLSMSSLPRQGQQENGGQDCGGECGEAEEGGGDGAATQGGTGGTHSLKGLGHAI